MSGTTRVLEPKVANAPTSTPSPKARVNRPPIGLEQRVWFPVTSHISVAQAHAATERCFSAVQFLLLCAPVELAIYSRVLTGLRGSKGVLEPRH